MKTPSQLITLLLFVLILFACQEEEKYFNGPEHLYDCHQANTWDSLKVHNALIGEWKWDYIYCNIPGGTDSDTYKGLIIEFKADNTLDVVENGQVSQTSTWEVKSADGGLYWIEPKPFVSQLVGAIYFCDDRVEFLASNGDYCDNYFTKK